MSFIADFFPTFITVAGGKHEQDRPIDGIDMTTCWFGGQDSPRQEIVFDVAGSVRLPTLRAGDFKLMGDALYNIRTDPGEQHDVAEKHPDVVARLRERLQQLAA